MRPGDGFEPLFPLTTKVDVNGKDAHPLWTAVKAAVPIPEGGDGEPDLVFLKAAHLAWWSPVRRDDVAWNFEKVLISRSGEVVSRHSRHTPVEDLASKVEELL